MSHLFSLMFHLSWKTHTVAVVEALVVVVVIAGRAGSKLIQPAWFTAGPVNAAIQSARCDS